MNAREEYYAQRNKALRAGDFVKVRDDLNEVYTNLSKTTKRLDQRGKMFEIKEKRFISNGNARYYLEGLDGVQWERCMLIRLEREVNEI